MKKKVMLAAAMLLMVGGLSACGPNKEKILQKTIDSQSKIKSGELDSNVSVIAKADGYSKKILMDLDVTFTLKGRECPHFSKWGMNRLF